MKKVKFQEGLLYIFGFLGFFFLPPKIKNMIKGDNPTKGTAIFIEIE